MKRVAKCPACNKDCTVRMKINFDSYRNGRPDPTFILGREFCALHGKAALVHMENRPVTREEAEKLGEEILKSGYTFDRIMFELVDVDWKPDPLVTQEHGRGICKSSGCSKPAYGKIALTVPVKWPVKDSTEMETRNAYIEGVELCRECLHNKGIMVNEVELQMAIEAIAKKGGVPQVDGITAECVGLDWTPVFNDRDNLSYHLMDELRIKKAQNAHNN